MVRVQLRWMEATLAEWYGDFAQARRQYETARQIHLQTELYTAGSADLAFNTLEWERGALAESDPGVVEPDSWTDMLSLSFMQKIESSTNLYYSVLSSSNLMGKIVDINSLYCIVA